MLLLRALALLLVALLLLATWPQALRLERTHVFAQLVALRGVLVLIGVAGAAVAGLVAWRVLQARQFGVVVCLALLSVAALNVGVLVARGLGGSHGANPAAGDLTVFAWNTLGDRPGAPLIAEVALAHGVDVLALPETTQAAALEVARLMEDAGRPVQVFSRFTDDSNPARSTSLLVSAALGEYRLDETVGSTPRAPSLVARPANGAGPTFVAAHPVPPVPSRMGDWISGIEWLAARCREGEVIVAGDFNATLDHLAGLADEGANLGACHDGAAALDRAGVGTWPTRLPPFLGTPIDHVMATEQWEFVDFRVLTELDGAGSDHRALLATLRRVR